MRPFLIVTFFLLTGIVSEAQHYHFVYLQTDNKQPFYIKVKEKLFSSSASGYVVIPKLEAGKHTLIVGFPKNEWPSQNISISIADKDLGFSLKNFEAKGWGLFNLQTMEVISASNGVRAQSTSVTETKTDQFSNVLADVVNTPSIKEEKKEITKVPPPPVPVKEVEVINKNNPTTITVEKKEVVKIPPFVPVIEAEVSKENSPSIDKAKVESIKIQKLSSTTDGEGMAIVYVDKQSSGSDTIEIIIPIVSNIALEPLKPIVVPETINISDTLVKSDEQSIKTEYSKANPKFIEIELPNPNTTSEEEKVVDKSKPEPANGLEKETTAVQPSVSAKPVMINSDCKQMATDDDFLKVRKKMTAEDTDDEMIIVAKKMFKQKCYSTEQIKNLSVLFLKDEGKYKLFDAAYPYVYDTQNFKLLESQLSDAYYISRFKAMIRN